MLAVTDMPKRTDAARAEVVSMEVDVAVDGGECSFVKLERSVLTAGDGVPVLAMGGVPGAGPGAVVDLGRFGAGEGAGECGCRFGDLAPVHPAH